MRIEYNKLVRDRIPEIIRDDGRQCATMILSENEYRESLLAKLTEEAREASIAPLEKLPAELADIREVLDAVLAAYQIPEAVVSAEHVKRRTERGGFEQKNRLLWTE